MPAMSREYCRKTSIKKMGFSQKSSCKAQELITRTSRKLYGKLVKSKKYKKDFSVIIQRKRNLILQVTEMKRKQKRRLEV